MNTEKKMTVEEELERCKAVAFYLLRAHRVAPEGRKLQKGQKAINKMSADTVEFMISNLDEKILAEYREAVSGK